MDDKPRNDYSNRELEQNFMQLHEKIKELGTDVKDALRDISTDVKATREQATKTNGRVNELEWWRKAVIWGLGLLWIIVTGIAPMIYYFARTEISRIVEDTIKHVSITCHPDSECTTTISKDYEK